MFEKQKNWYVVYTKPRWEKQVYVRLIEAGIEAYCPLNRTRKKWSDRIKWVDEPLFKSYVFVRTAEEEMTAIRMVGGVLNFVYWLHKPAIIKDKEIELIRKFLNEYKEVEAVAYDVRKDSAIRIRKGVFMNKMAKVVKVYNNKVQVVIESIGYALIATIDRSNVAVI